MAVESWLEQERDHIALWLPVMLGTGIAAWLVMPTREGWIALIAGACGGAVLALGFARDLRAGRVAAVALLAVAFGAGLVWARSCHVAAPRLDRPQVARFAATVESVEARPAQDSMRLLLRTDAASGLPPRLRVNAGTELVPAGLAAGDRIKLRARLVPPPEAALPGSYDFARIAWFKGIGGTGRALDPLLRLDRGRGDGAAFRLAGLRARLTSHVHARLDGSAGGIAAALLTGDQGAIADEDAEAMRTAGLAHLLSISGLHVGVVVGGAMLLLLRTLALSRRLALHLPLPLIAAAGAALAGVVYTLIAGAEVPTVRSCIAALLILVALAVGREALTLRLVAAGALFVLLLWPEAVAGPSFQLSFAAVTVLVAVHEHPRIRDLLARREEMLAARWMRAAGGLLLTGLAIEIALTPIALFHFHRSGLYGAVANMIAIPLTTFVIMPLEAIALLFDTVGLGGPFWWLCGVALDALLALAHRVSLLPGATAALPSMPTGAFAAMIAGGLWLLLWRTHVRRWGLALLCGGALWAAATPAPDLLITNDGRHLAFRDPRYGMVLLRGRAGDYVRQMIGEASGAERGLAIDDLPGARCSPDLCVARMGGQLLLAATRSRHFVAVGSLARVCGVVDIVVSDRSLPASCRPRWLKADAALLKRSGGLAIRFARRRVESVRVPEDDHPWR